MLSQQVPDAQLLLVLPGVQVVQVVVGVGQSRPARSTSRTSRRRKAS